MYDDPFLRSCINDIHLNENTLKELDFELSLTGLLISFPRSGNGWVRYVLAIYFATFVDRYMSSSKWDGLIYSSLEELFGLKSPAFLPAKGRKIPIDAYVPDLYLHERVMNALLTYNGNDIESVSPKRIFKTHHLVPVDHPFKSVALLVRHPKECILSSSLLLAPDLIDKTQCEIREIVQFYSEKYRTYLSQFLALATRKNTYVVNLHDIVPSLARWISFQTDTAEESDVLRNMGEVVSHFPLRSGFDKRINDKIDLSEISSYSDCVIAWRELSSASNAGPRDQAN